MEGGEHAHDIFLLEDRDYGGGLIVVVHADGRQAGAHGIVVHGNGGEAVAVQDERSDVLAVLDGGEEVGQGLKGVEGLVVGVVLLGQGLIPDEVLGDGDILQSGDAVDLAVDGDSAPVILVDQAVEVRGDALHEVGDVGKGADLNVGAEGAEVGEYDVVGLVGADDGAAAGIPVAPANDIYVQVNADLLLEIGVKVGLPGIVVVGHAVADHVPGELNDLTVGGLPAGRRAGVGGLGSGLFAAAGHEDHQHEGREEQCKNSFLHIDLQFFISGPAWRAP